MNFGNPLYGIFLKISRRPGLKLPCAFMKNKYLYLIDWNRNVAKEGLKFFSAYANGLGQEFTAGLNLFTSFDLKLSTLSMSIIIKFTKINLLVMIFAIFFVFFYKTDIPLCLNPCNNYIISLNSKRLKSL